MKIQAIKLKRAGNPVLPRDPRDPAHQFGNVKRAQTALNKTYKVIIKGVRDLIDQQKQIQTIATNADYYEYEISPERYNAIDRYLERLLYNQLLNSDFGTFGSNWWLRANLEKSFGDGLTDAVKSAQSMATPELVGEEVSKIARQIDTEQLFTPQMTNRLGLVYSRVFNNMKGLTDSTRVDLAETLTSGMSNGLGIKAISRNIMKRVEVSYNRAFRIARTEILTSYRTATRAETKELNESVYDDSEWQMRLLWWSALIPGKNGTRKTHGAKHGKTLTAQDVEAFYSKDGNAINCYCSQSPILVNTKTGETIQTELLERMRAQKKVWRAGMI